MTLDRWRGRESRREKSLLQGVQWLPAIATYNYPCGSLPLKIITQSTGTSSKPTLSPPSLDISL